jgi:uncharacterized membrane protein YvbJ
MSRKLKPPETCPVCGENVPRGSLACPECGADHTSGWREGADTYDALDLPGDRFNYDEFVREEFGSGRKSTAIKPMWWIAAIVIALAFALMCFYVAG